MTNSVTGNISNVYINQQYKHFNQVKLNSYQSSINFGANISERTIKKGASLLSKIRDDIRVILQKDPAAKNSIEVLFFYPGFQARTMHRLANKLYEKKVPFFPRMISSFSRFMTGIEIHPGAKIGDRFFIDHGMGTVIGETAEIGDDVMLFHQVTLGATGKQSGGKRHPTLGDRVMVSAGAKIIGPVHIGDDVKIGANSVVLNDLPNNVTAVGIPAKIVRQDGKKIPHDDIAESVKDGMDKLAEEIKKIKDIIGDKS